VTRRHETGLWLFLGTFLAGLAWPLIYLATWRSSVPPHQIILYIGDTQWIPAFVGLVLVSTFLFSLWLMYGDAPAEPLNSAKD